MPTSGGDLSGESAPPSASHLPRPAAAVEVPVSANALGKRKAGEMDGTDGVFVRDSLPKRSRNDLFKEVPAAGNSSTKEGRGSLTHQYLSKGIDFGPFSRPKFPYSLSVMSRGQAENAGLQPESTSSAGMPGANPVFRLTPLSLPPLPPYPRSETTSGGLVNEIPGKVVRSETTDGATPQKPTSFAIPARPIARQWASSGRLLGTPPAPRSLPLLLPEVPLTAENVRLQAETGRLQAELKRLQAHPPLSNQKTPNSSPL
ncbi:hypothetical protein JAAARDRAFT_42746 [Jaapia argillacea MUCL 33604]|uniref:Uncharacterized protein n=1 Tax=Jaapia argillacea MUCL 33604 TaxID=933084 RepID=A0A067P6X9_9AGAM|nr:hypothetical protein JAAARDRAFT_42746 [Jaapia argillacea MUCL 33604]